MTGSGCFYGAIQKHLHTVVKSGDKYRIQVNQNSDAVEFSILFITISLGTKIL